MGALLVFVAAFGAYAWTASPAAGWLDSSEFVAASATLGVAHSPGHPIPVLLGRAASLLPVGDVPFRVALASAAAVAAAAACAYLAARKLAVRLAPDAHARVHETVAASVGLGFAASGAAWIQAVRAEVYGLEIAVLALALVLLLDPREKLARSLPAAGLAVGLGLANHHFVTLLFALPAAVYALAQRPGARALGRTAMCGLLGLSAFLYLPIRAARDPLVDWGDPDTLGRLAWTISAKAFQKSLAAGEHTQARSQDALQLAVTLVAHISIPATLLVGLGVYLWIRRRAAPGALLLLAGVVALGATGRIVLGFDFDNPDALGYLLPVVLALLLLAGAGAALAVDTLLVGRARRAILVPLLVVAAIPVLQVVTHAADSSRRHADGSDVYARAVLERLPPRAVLLTSYFETCFQMWALQAVEDDRPDVIQLDRGFATYPGMEALARRQHPEVAALVAAGMRIGVPAPLDALDALSATRPVYFEPSATLDAALRPHLVPAAPLARYAPAPLTPAERDAAERDDDAGARALARTLLAADADEPGGRRLALWTTYLRAELYCSLDRPAAARAALALAHDLAGDDPVLMDLAERCHLAARP